jgi:hypothetical protein
MKGLAFALDPDGYWIELLKKVRRFLLVIWGFLCFLVFFGVFGGFWCFFFCLKRVKKNDHSKKKYIFSCAKIPFFDSKTPKNTIFRLKTPQKYHFSTQKPPFSYQKTPIFLSKTPEKSSLPKHPETCPRRCCGLRIRRKASLFTGQFWVFS